MQCYSCHTNLELKADQNIPRGETCPKCLRDLRVCRMCIFYDTQAYNACKESNAMRVVEKEKANFCDYFKLNSLNTSQNSKADILAAANALFKK